VRAFISDVRVMVSIEMEALVITTGKTAHAVLTHQKTNYLRLLTQGEINKEFIDG
jgi:hypothetical protein